MRWISRSNGKVWLHAAEGQRTELVSEFAQNYLAKRQASAARHEWKSNTRNGMALWGDSSFEEADERVLILSATRGAEVDRVYYSCAPKRWEGCSCTTWLNAKNAAFFTKRNWPWKIWRITRKGRKWLVR